MAAASNLVRYVPNPLFLRAIEASVTAEGALNYVAQEIADESERTAPYETGAYQRSFVAEENSVGSLDWKAMLLEYGTVDTPTFATMRTAVKTLGMDFKDAQE